MDTELFASALVPFRDHPHLGRRGPLDVRAQLAEGHRRQRQGTYDSLPARIEERLEHSCTLVLCMSANAFGLGWTQLEAGTFRFRDPLNKERRFIPLRLDDVPIKGSLSQFLYINWRPSNCEQVYAKLLEAYRPSAKPMRSNAPASSNGSRVWN